MNLFKSPIITASNDVFWADTFSLTAGLGPKPLLVITLPYVEAAGEQAQLAKMLEASGLNNQQYNIIQLKENQQVSWNNLRNSMEPKIIFLVGILPSQLGISALFVLNAPNNFNDRIWLPTVALSVLDKNATLKTQLWNNGMKPILKENKYGHL